MKKIAQSMKIKLLTFASIICITQVQSVHSATLYTGAVISEITSGSISDYQNAPANHVAAKFTVSGALSELKAVSYYGFYAFGGDNALTVTNDVFDVVILTDIGSGPGTLIGSGQTALTATRSVTGSSILGFGVYLYELNLTSTVALTAGNYWIAVSRNNPGAAVGTGGRWCWAGDHTGGPALQSQSAGQFVWSGTNNASPAFTLEDTTFAVPEPQTFGLALLGAAGCLAKRRRI